MTNPTPHGQVPAIQRYKIGYHSDDWGTRSSTPGGIADPEGSWVRYADHAAQVAALTQPAQVNTKTHDLLSTMIGLFLGAKETIGYKPGSAIDNIVAEAVEHLKDWPYPDTVQVSAVESNSAYAELPAPDATTVGLGAVWNRHSMRAFADRTHALRASRGQAPADAAPSAGAVAGPDDIDAIALTRYKVVHSHDSMFHRFAVVAGDGKQQLYLGRETECQNMTRKFAGAFLDGAFYQSQIAAAPTPAAQAADSVQEDAARYRLLRRGQHWSVIDGIGNDLRAEALDAAVDAARKQEASHDR